MAPVVVGAEEGSGGRTRQGGEGCCLDEMILCLEIEMIEKVTIYNGSFLVVTPFALCSLPN